MAGRRRGAVWRGAARRGVAWRGVAWRGGAGRGGGGGGGAGGGGAGGGGGGGAPRKGGAGGGGRGGRRGGGGARRKQAPRTHRASRHLRAGFSFFHFDDESGGHVVEGACGGQRASVVHRTHRCAAGASSTCPPLAAATGRKCPRRAQTLHRARGTRCRERRFRFRNDLRSKKRCSMQRAAVPGRDAAVLCGALRRSAAL